MTLMWVAVCVAAWWAATAFSFSLHSGIVPPIHVPSDIDPETSEMSDHWAVRVKDEADIHRIAKEHGFDLERAVGNLRDHFVLKAKPSHLRAHLPPLNQSSAILWAEQQVFKQRVKRSAPFFPDPKYPSQWHLHGDGTKDIKIESAWKSGNLGHNCQIAVVDDGLEGLNPDLKENYNPIGSYDFNYNDTDPTPDKPDDIHGTSAAGCAAAASNSVCGVGSAPKAKVAGIRILSKKVTDEIEAQALSYEYDINHIYTNSWGPTDDGKTVDGPGKLLTAAFYDAIQNGRNGKGSIYIWAAGNGKSYGDNGNYDGYNNKPFTISIGSYDSKMKSAYYSESCACLHAVSPSSGSGPAITTTSVSTVKNGCTTTFGGTSASAPVVAGVVCLMLAERPSLTWRDVQAIIVKAAAPVDPASPTWHTNGAGIAFSHSYGFGKIDTERILEVTKSWRPLAPPVYLDSGLFVLNTSSSTVLSTHSSTFSIESTIDIIIEHITLFFDVSIRRRGDLGITVISPSGMESLMVEKHGDLKPDLVWVTTSNAAWGESSLGVWKIVFTNLGVQPMTVNKYQLFLDGTDHDDDGSGSDLPT